MRVAIHSPEIGIPFIESGLAHDRRVGGDRVIACEVQGETDVIDEVMRLESPGCDSVHLGNTACVNAVECVGDESASALVAIPA